MSTQKQRQSQSEKKVSLKLIIDKKGKRILYGEADKTFIDFLFSILSYPVGSVVKLLSITGMVGSIGNVYRSVDDLNTNYFQSKQSKDNILMPTIQPTALSQLQNILPSKPSSSSSSSSSKAPTNDEEAGGGYVKGLATYMVMDDLSVIPMSSMSSLAKLKDFNVHDVAHIEEKTLLLGTKQGLMLLRASLHSSTVLNDVFLPSIHFP